ncbi:hypothetical protein GGR51DRAFT_555862 [Nemania sp. FL0031]|nr:hypothetical protein GGR51DRAFT_555862 [Nemania sp. FL0031]
MLIEVITRLTEKPAVGSDSKPDDENYLTTGALDVLYDQNNDAYEAKSDITLIETVRIEETDRMRKYQIRLLKAVEQYELEVGSKDIKVSTGISLTSQHNWNDVLGEAEVVREKYISQEGSNSISTIGDGLSTYELAPSKVEQWLALLPSAAPCASRLCGGLRIVFAIIWRSGILYNETYSALSEIPVIIANAQDLSPRYDQPTLAGHVEQLYCAVISMLGHILLEYCRASTGPHVRFSHGFELMHRYKKLIQPEQEVVINQRVRVQTLNFLKSMRNKLWDRIFTVLNEELAKTQHDQELEGIYEDMKKTRETSVNAQLYKALKYDHLLPHLDMRVTMRQGFHFSAAEKSRMSWLVENESLRDWITSPTSDLFLINGNEVRHEFTSPVSVYCGMLTRALQSQPPRVVLYWYCGLHLRETVAGVLGNLIGQLLYYIEADKSSLKSNQKVWYAGLIPDDPESLFRLFATILKHQLKLVSVFCILDGISFYEDGYRGKELIELIAALEALISEAQESKGIFKVLLTSPTRSRTVREEKITDLNSTEVLNMPRFIMMGRRPRGDFEALRDISRRSSISSVGSAVSEYYDAPEYLDD